MQRTLSAVRQMAVPLTRRVLNQAVKTNAVQTPMVFRLTPRQFSTVRPLLAESPKEESKPSTPADSTAVVESPALTSFGEIVQKYGGWYPFLGLAGVIAISKEIIILNEEFLMISNFATMFAVLYLTAGDAITKAAEEARMELHKKMDDVSDFQIEQVQGLLNAHKLNVEQVEVLKRLKTEHNTLSTELNRVRALKLRHQAREAVVKKLNDLKSREASERASFKEIVGARATAYVRRQFAAAPANVKASLVDFAIDVVEGKKKQLDAKADPVKKLYADYFNNKLYIQELEAEKQQKA